MKKQLGVAVSALALLAVGACSSNAKTTDQAAAPQAAASMSASASAGSASAPFGPGCAAVPTDSSNPGSFDAMSKVPVATAASGNPQLKTLVAAVTAAGLGDTLNSAQGVTVFAPDNAAFAAIPADQLKSVMANKAELTKILEYHVVSGRLAPDQLAGTHATLEGSNLTVTGSGQSFKVNNANIVCGNVQTANATVYIIDSVLMPQ
ncbi:MAG TPA: fasciclin domain-containing protein [Micromonosporaceae bacterium]